MKKLLLIVFFLLPALTFADQLAWITKEQAEKTVVYFEDNEIEKVVLWCACCTGQLKRIVTVSDIYYRKSDISEYYEVWIEGKSSSGEKVKEPVDLAYVHIKKGGKWKCLGAVLKFECDPCTKPFRL